ncbi:unnamed protein product, partial [Nesidiocoris tenuis]
NHGIERLELYDHEDDASKKSCTKLITLENCVKISLDPQKNQQFAFSIITKTATHLFASTTSEDSVEWVIACQGVAFRDTQSSTTIEEDNELYCPSGDAGVFHVILVSTDASTRCSLASGDYVLVVANEELQLRKSEAQTLLFTWPYRRDLSILKFRNHQVHPPLLAQKGAFQFRSGPQMRERRGRLRFRAQQRPGDIQVRHVQDGVDEAAARRHQERDGSERQRRQRLRRQERPGGAEERLRPRSRQSGDRIAQLRRPHGRRRGLARTQGQNTQVAKPARFTLLVGKSDQRGAEDAAARPAEARAEKPARQSGLAARSAALRPRGRAHRRLAHHGHRRPRPPAPLALLAHLLPDVRPLRLRQARPFRLDAQTRRGSRLFDDLPSPRYVGVRDDTPYPAGHTEGRTAEGLCRVFDPSLTYGIVEKLGK